MKLGPVSPDLVNQAPDQQADQDISRIRGAWAKEHNPDGSHGTIQGSLSIVGNMTATAQPRVCLYAATQAITANTWTKVVWQAPQTLNGLIEFAYDTGGMFISGSNWFSVLVAGVYLVSCSLYFEIDATGTRYMGLNIGKGRGRIADTVTIPTAVDVAQLQLTAIVPFAVGDNFQIDVFQSTVGNLNLGGTGVGTANAFNFIHIIKIS